MTQRIPSGAFGYYVSLGEERSYEAVAEHYGVSKRSVTRVATKENWAERLAKIESEANARVDEKLASDLEEMKLRHRKILRAMATRAAQAIAAYPLTDGMEGIKAAEAVIKLERLLAGEATERNELSVEQVILKEFAQLMVPAEGNGALGAQPEGDDDDEDDAQAQ